MVGETGESIGEFDFDQSPGNDDSVTVPWPAYVEGFRIFDVTEVLHMAVVVTSEWGTGPQTVIRTLEIP